MNGFVRILSIAFLVADVRGQADCVETTLDCNDPVPTIFKLGDGSCACSDAAHAGALKYSNGKVYLCVGTEWKTFQLQGEYGTESTNPGVSCKDILNKAGKQLSNGVFWIRLEGKWMSNSINGIYNKILDCNRFTSCR